MDDKFMETLKSFSVQDMLEEHRPRTSHRLGTARGPLRPPTTAYPTRGQSTTTIPDDSEITTLATYRPESAAFTFSFNRPKTGRLDSARTTLRGPPPSANRNRQGNGTWDSNGFNNIRPMTSNRGNRLPAQDETVEFIPDLDDVREEDLTMTVASAPTYEVQKMTSLKELDAELLSSKPFSVVDGVNLRKLCRFLVPEKELSENDEYWTWDRLYTEIISTPELSHLVRFQRKESDNDVESLSSKVPYY